MVASPLCSVCPRLLCVFLLQLDKAESILLSMRNTVKEGGDVLSLILDIQEHVPGLISDGSLAAISKAFDFCQVC